MIFLFSVVLYFPPFSVEWFMSLYSRHSGAHTNVP